jgi:hypothetical protein
MWNRSRVSTSRARTWRWPAIPMALVALALLTLTACDSSAVGPAPTNTAANQATATSTSAGAPNATNTPSSSGPYKVLVYFSKKPDSLSDPTKVFPVNRYSPTLGVATYAIQQLISGPSAVEKSSGYFSEIQGLMSGVSNCGGADFQITLDHKGPTAATGYATVKFCRAVNLPGDLSGAYIRAEINAIMLQFPNNKHVVILDYQGGCFDDLSGQNLCLT